MRGFDVLSRHLPLYQNHFLEASAGTGKTFAIENIVVRLLMDPAGPAIDQVLVVTFTRAATLELKKRIHQNITNTLDQIEHPTEDLPSYLIELLERGGKREAISRLRKALATYDEAKIFTIHSFCLYTLQQYALEAGIGLEIDEESAPIQTLGRIVKDFLQTELSLDQFSLGQLEKVLKRHQNNPDLLVRKLVEVARKRRPIEGALSFGEYKQALFDTIEALKEKYGIQSDPLFSQLLELAPYFGKLCDRSRRVKPEIERGLRNFANLFETPDDDFIDLPVLKMVPENQLKRDIANPLLEILQKEVFPILQAASDERALFARLAEQTRQHMERVIEKEELLFFEDFLHKMENRVRDKVFAQKVRAEYRAVLVDEFQDTDDIQWNIFSTLFLDQTFSGPLYLVGDPKQSIYRFRNANIYTYLEAKEALGKEAQASLLRNFRQEPPLLSALNQLFQNPDDWLALPKTGKSLPCPPLEAASEITTVWRDKKKSVHFALAEEEKALFSFIIQEVHKLHTDYQIPLRECAVLVKDRYQAGRFLDFSSLPVIFTKSRSLLDSPAFPVLDEFLRAVIYPQNRHHVARALGGPLFKYTLEEVTQLPEEAIESFYTYHHLLYKKGLLAVFNALMEKQGPFLAGIEGSGQLIQDLLQIVELMVEKSESIDQYLLFLDRLKQEDPEAEILQARAASEGDAIQVMTIHASKGLEFEVVFPLGLTAHTTQNEDAEERAEQMRLLYVAATRAKRRLYFPYLTNKCSTLSLFLQKRFKSTSFETFVDQNKELFSLSHCFEPAQTFFPKKEPPSLPLLIPEKSTFTFNPLTLHSYSSLAQHERELSFPSPKEQLPSGPEVGLLLHQVLEKYPMTQPNILLKNTMLEPWISEVNEIAYNAFNTPLPCLSAPFPLSAVDPAKMIREMEFIFPSNDPPGFFKGFIDLFFEHEGNYYFVDWKSNYLGDTKEAYSRPHLEKVMQDFQYTLQANIYREAVEKYLDIFQKKHLFGGYYYLFIRGLSLSGQTGIYYIVA